MDKEYLKKLDEIEKDMEFKLKLLRMNESHDLKQKILSHKIMIEQIKNIKKSNNLLCDILKEYCSNGEHYETERNSEAEAVMFLKEQGLIEIIKGEFPKTKNIKFKFVKL